LLGIARSEGIELSELPSGTVTFLFPDLEGSTRLWEEHPDLTHDALARHDELVRAAIEGQGGSVVKTTAATGDWVGAIRGCVESNDARRRFHTPLAGGFVSSAATAFVALGQPEPAAILFGFASTTDDGFSAVHAEHELVAAAQADLATRLDDATLAALTARGAALSTEEAVTYPRSEAARVLGDEDAS